LRSLPFGDPGADSDPNGRQNADPGHTGATDYANDGIPRRY